MILGLSARKVHPISKYTLLCARPQNTIIYTIAMILYLWSKHGAKKEQSELKVGDQSHFEIWEINSYKAKNGGSGSENTVCNLDR